MNSSPPNHLPYTSINNTSNNSNNKHLHNNNSNKTPFQLTQPVSVESIVAALRELTQSKSAPPIMAYEIRPPGFGGYGSGWSTNGDTNENHDNNQLNYTYSRDASENRVDETDNTAATNGWHHRTDAQRPTIIDSAASLPYNNSSRFNNHNEQMHQHHYHHQQQSPPPPPPAPRTVQHVPTNRHPSFNQTPYPEPHARFEANRVHFDQPVPPAPSYSTEDIPGGQRNHSGYDNAYSTVTTTPETDLWFNGDYKGDDGYISEDVHAPRSEH
ncbi:hypothetical protein BGW39_009182 [Mortierella sp. 14UC]|nr:hypothetical protein BGW39_009182 [Mortierella sp. 14UC]